MMTPVKDSTRPVNYEMTPQGADKWDQNPSSIDNYNIEVFQWLNQSECANNLNLAPKIGSPKHTKIIS